MQVSLESFLPMIQKSLEIASSNLKWLSSVTLDPSTEAVEKGSEVTDTRGATVIVSDAKYVPIAQRGPLYEESENPHYMERHQMTLAFGTLFACLANAAGKGAAIVVRVLSDDGIAADKKTAVVTDPKSGVSFSVRDYGSQPSERARYTVDIAYGVAS